MKAQGYLIHHGVKGQQWGVRNGPPYPLKEPNQLEKGAQKVNEILYHGTTHNIEGELEPRVTYELKPLVFATNDYYYALIRAGKFDIHKPLIREDYDDGFRSLAEVVPGAFKEVFDRPGYIYEVDNSKFKYNVGTEFISNDKAKITKTHAIDNVWNEIQKNKDKYELVTYENPGDYWDKVRGGREGYLERKMESVKRVDDFMKEIEKRKVDSLT